MIWLYVLLGVIGLFVLIFIILFIFVLKSYNKMFNKRFMPDPLITYYKMEEFNLDCKRIEINCNGEYIRGGIYTYGDYDKNKIIIFSHGMGACKDAYMQEIGTLAQKGFMVLGYDYLGTYESDGKMMGFADSVKSLDYVINYVKNSDDLKNKEIYVMGHSWGGYATINIVKFHKDVKGVIALAPFVSVNSLLRYGIKRRSVITILMIELIELLRFGKYADCDGLKSLKGYSGKIMLLQSTDDNQVKYEKALGYLKKNLKDKAKYVIMNDRLHNPDYTLDSIKYFNEFFSNINKYKGEELKDYFKKQNFHKMGELDSVVIDKIVNFIKN